MGYPSFAHQIIVMFDNPNANVSLDRDTQAQSDMPDFSDSIMPRAFQVASRESGGAERQTSLEQLRQNLSRDSVMQSIPQEHRERALDIVSRFAAGDQSGFNFESLTEGRYEALKLNGLGMAVNQVLNRFGYGLKVQFGGHTIDALTITHPSRQVYKEFRRNTVAPTYFDSNRRPQNQTYLNDTTFAEPIRNALAGRGSSLPRRRA